VEHRAARKITALHQSFVDAGADILLTNSFGGTRYRLKLHQAQDRVAELNTTAARWRVPWPTPAAATIAVGGSMGPTGEIMEPIGPLSIAQATEAFAEQARALAAGGADVLWIETMSSARGSAGGRGRRRHDRAADRLHAELRHQRPHDDGHLAQRFFAALEKTLVAAPGRLRHQLRRGRFRGGGLHPQPGCGRRPGRGAGGQGQLRHSAVCGRRHLLQRHARTDGGVRRMALDAGARIIGGCCGTSPRHLRAMRDALDAHTRPSPIDSWKTSSARWAKSPPARGRSGAVSKAAGDADKSAA
jgi:5-methyltetrahydrofolate--homocysteine methyltransferase